MEHLVFVPDITDPSETVSACRNDTLSADWTDFEFLIDFIAPTTPWLGFEHDKMPRTDVLTQYPTYSNWNIDHLWNGNLRQAHCDLENLPDTVIAKRVASFLQAWLYYGLLEAVIAKKIHVSYLVRVNADGEELLYSRNLQFCLQSRVFSIRLATSDQKLSAHQEILENLRFVQTWVSRLVAWSVEKFRQTLDKAYPGFMDHVSQITPAIVRLAEAISETRLFVLRDYPTSGTEAWHIPIDVVEERRKRMKLGGWCDFQIRLLEDTTNQSTVDWFVIKKIHQDPTGHDKCKPSACTRNNIDASSYKQLHCSDSCRCIPLFPNLARVMSIVNEGKICVVRLEFHEGTPNLRINAMNKKEAGDYVAISHVWVDGLGGSTEQGLLCCQVMRLATLVSRVVDRPGVPTNFWIDSLCIPRSDKQIYYKALVGIRDVYMCASTVVVMDKLIQRCDRAAPTEVLYAHIYISAWMQRMWTYEEAVLAKNLRFVLRNDEVHTYDSTTQPEMRRTVSVVWEALAAQLFRLRTNSSEVNIGHISRAFRWRLTNATQDEFLSISSTLGLDITSLEELRGDDRTKKFWLLLHEIPFDVPFLEGPKLSIPGFRWAPKTLMFPSQTAMDTNPEGNKCYCTERGLLGTYLLASISRVLEGCNHGSQSIFFVLINKRTTQPVMEDKIALRVYCTQNWPIAPQGMPFDTIILASPDRSIPQPGKWFPGVALLHSEIKSNEYAFVGRVLLETLRYEEIMQSQATVMYAGSNRTLIDSRGDWCVAEICIT